MESGGDPSVSSVRPGAPTLAQCREQCAAVMWLHSAGYSAAAVHQLPPVARITWQCFSSTYPAGGHVEPIRQHYACGYRSPQRCGSCWRRARRCCSTSSSGSTRTAPSTSSSGGGLGAAGPAAAAAALGGAAQPLAAGGAGPAVGGGGVPGGPMEGT